MTGSEIDFGKNRYVDLEQSFALGNKAALHEAISRSIELGAPLPPWASSELQKLLVEKWAGKLNTWNRPPPDPKKPPPDPKKPPPDPEEAPPPGYKALIANYIRSEVYRACMLWVVNKHHYKQMPTKCILAWYNSELDDLPKGKQEAAMTVALIGLQGTPAEKTSYEFLEKQRYFDTIPEIKKLKHSHLDADFLEMSHDEYRCFIADTYRDHRKTPLSFGYKDTEVIFGLRDEEQFWGPPKGSPPAHIQAILDAEPFPWSEQPSTEEK